MKLKLQIGSKTLIKDGQAIKMDVAPFTENDRTYVPIRFIAEALGLNVEWDDSTQTVTITDDIPTKHQLRFDNIDDCAVDFAMCYNPLSIALNREISAVITKDEKGYFYTNVYLGVENGAAIQSKGYEHISDIHTHGSAAGYKTFDKFSTQDIKSMRKDNVDGYMVSPYGTVQRYLLSENKSIFISKNVPFDVNEYDTIVKKYPDVAENIKYFKEYFGTKLPDIDAEDNKYTTSKLSWCNKANHYIDEFRKVML